MMSLMTKLELIWNRFGIAAIEKPRFVCIYPRPGRARTVPCSTGAAGAWGMGAYAYADVDNVVIATSAYYITVFG